MSTVKSSENKPRQGLYFSKALFEGLIFGRGLHWEGNLCFKIDWASLIVGRKFMVFALFYFVFEGNFPSTSPRGAYIWWGDLTEVFLRRRFGGLIFGGAYFRNFTVCDERSFLNRGNTTNVPNQRVGENPGNEGSTPRFNIWLMGLI